MNLLKQTRKAKKISQGQLSRKTGIHRNYISRVEREEIKYPRVDLAHKLAAALGRQVEEIWIFED